MLDSIISDCKSRMQKSVDALHTDLNKLRSGRAHPSLLEHIMVDYYGNQTPLNQVANITVEDARTLGIKPWEKNMVPVIEKAIMTSELGINPSTSGDLIRIPLPPPTEARRKEMVKMARSEGENAKVSVRNARRDANSSVKELLKAKELTEDEERKAQEHIQKLTDEFIKEIDTVLEHKEKDLMEV